MLLRVFYLRAFSDLLDLCCRRCVSVAGSAAYIFENPRVFSKVRRSASSPPLVQSLGKTFEILGDVSAPAWASVLWLLTSRLRLRSGDGWSDHHTTTWWVRPPRVAGATADFEADMGTLVGRLDGFVADMEVSCGH